MLVILVNLPHEPISGKGQREHPEHADKIADVAHPIVMFPFCLTGRQEIPDACVGPANKPAQHHVGNESVNVDRPPRRIPRGSPRPINRRPVCNHHGTGLEGGPRVGHDHDSQGKQVEQKAQEEVEPFFLPLHRVPPVPIQIEGGGFQEKQDAVQNKGREKNIGKVRHEFGIQADQEEEQNAAEQGRGRIGGRQQLGKFFSQRVIPGFFGLPSDDLTDPGKDRHAQHESGKEKMLLRNDPDDVPAAESGNVPILHGHGLCRGVLSPDARRQKEKGPRNAPPEEGGRVHLWQPGTSRFTCAGVFHEGSSSVFMIPLRLRFRLCFDRFGRGTGFLFGPFACRRVRFQFF